MNVPSIPPDLTPSAPGREGPRRSIVRGRDRELEAIGEALGDLRSGVGRVIVIEGQPGIGKSLLIEEAAKIAGRLPARVGRGIAASATRAADLGTLTQAVADLSPVRSGAAADPSRAEDAGWILQELQERLETSAIEGGPIVLALDDLQWADPGTVAALGVLPGRLASSPIAWVLAARSRQTPAATLDVLDSLVDGGALRLTIGPLDEDSVEQVVLDTLGSAPDAELLAIAAEAGGNPFDLGELLTGLRDEGMIRLDDEQAELVERRIPARVREGMYWRLARMSESARRLAIVAASLGTDFSLGDLSRMLGAPPSGLLVAVDQLTRADIFRERDEAMAFRHDLTREAVRAAVPASTRRALDREAVDVLLAGGAGATEVAAQLAESAEPGDEAAVALLARVAESLAGSDPASAADLARRALGLAGHEHPQRGRLVAQTAQLLHAAGRVEEAEAFCDRELREILPVGEESEVCLGIEDMFGVSPDARAAMGRRALRLVGLSAADRARHQTRLAYNLVQAGRPEEARTELEGARAAVAVAPEERSARAILLLAEGALHYVDGEFEDALALHEEGMRELPASVEPMRRWVVRQWRAELLAVLGRLEEAGELVDEGIVAATRGRQAWAVDFFETWRGRQLLQAGRLADAAATLNDRFEPFEPRQIVGSLYAAGIVALGRTAIHTGDGRTGRGAAALAETMLERGTPSTLRHAAWLLSLQAMAAGDPGRAAERLRRAAAETGAPILPLFPMDVTDEPQLVRIMLADGDVLAAEEMASASAARASRNPGLRGVAAASAHCRGLLTGRAESLSEAVESLEGEGRPLSLASALEDLGRVRLSTGAEEEGLAALGRALEIYARIGAGWDAGRVRSRLRSSGVRRRLLPVERPSSGWEALTDSEVSVARLVAEGLTNREVASRLFVSPHTVNSHLRKVFLKLGVNSRTALVRLVGERDRGLPPNAT